MALSRQSDVAAPQRYSQNKVAGIRIDDPLGLLW